MSGAVTLQSVKVVNNHAFYDGGGIWAAASSTVEIVSSEILNKTALGLGGGLYNAGTADLSRRRCLALGGGQMRAPWQETSKP